MGAIAEWIVQVGCLALIAGLVELLLPSSSVRGAVRLVAGLVVILAVVDPVVRWLGDPSAIERLAGSLLADDGRRYVEAGVRLAEEEARSASRAWAESLERQLEAMAALVAGGRDVEAEVRTDAGAVSGVRVGLKADPGAWEESAARVRRLVESFFPGVHPSAVVITER